jgi:hypothetical protein
MPLDRSWHKEPIPAPGWKVVSEDGVELAWVYGEERARDLPAGDSSKPTLRQAEWLAGMIADLPDMLRLDDDVREALGRYMAERPELKSPGAAASYLLRDHLIGLGLLPLGEKNRSQGARRSKG